MRLLSPDDACVEVDLGRRRYRGTAIDVNDSSHIKALRAVGYTVADAGGRPVRRGAGFVCPVCEFKSYFRACSRCRAVCERDS